MTIATLGQNEQVVTGPKLIVRPGPLLFVGGSNKVEPP